MGATLPRREGFATPIFNDLDLGPNLSGKRPTSGQQVGVLSIPGGYAVPYSTGSSHPAWAVTFMFQAWNAVGQYAAGTQKAVEYLGRQLEELARNPDLQPVYVQLFAGTNLPVASWVQPQDGWYIISHCEVDYTRSFSGVAIASLGLEYVSPGPPRRIGMSTVGGALTSNYSGGAHNVVPFPFNGISLQITTSRTTGEGLIQLTQNDPAVNPAPFVPSATIGDWFKGGCRVYDAMAAIGTNPVPAPPTFVNSNWIEVKGPDHRFVGDIVVTNGLILLTLSPAGATQIAQCYLWNTALGTPGWQQFGTLVYQDTVPSAGAGTLRHVSLQRVGLEEVVIRTIASTTGGNVGAVNLRLQRGSFAVRADFTPQSQANTYLFSLYLLLTANAKMVYNSGGVADVITNPTTAPAAQTDYGYAGAWTANSANPYTCGLLWQNQPAQQPSFSASNTMGVGDSSGPAVNATRSYGVWAIPFSSVLNYQAEAESGGLSSGWSSIADGAASAGNTAKCVSGTLVNNTNVFGTTWSPPAGTYNVWFRVKVTSAAGAASEMSLGVHDSTSGTNTFTTFKANQASTSYVWLLAVTGVAMPLAHAGQFIAFTAATLGTDWFIDAAALVPTTSTTLNFPQDLWQQFLYDRSTALWID